MDKYCSNCGKQVSSEAEICPNCGVRLMAKKEKKSKVTAALLALFLGWIGIHKFYLGRTVLGIFYLLFCWTFIPAFVAFIEAIIYFSMKEEDFDRAYNT